MCANVRECPANVRECVRMCANAAVYLRECLRMCRECVKMLPRMFANVRVFVANVCESMPYLRMELVTSAVGGIHQALYLIPVIRGLLTYL